MSVSGHLATVGGLIRRSLFPVKAPASSAWSTTVEDPTVGPLVLSGRLSTPAEARSLVILVHGLGGSSDSEYMKAAARAATDLGMASLRFNLRGADGRSPDFYHGGLTDDLHAAISKLVASGFERIFVMGFSLGGHVALRFATETEENRVAAVAALCSPLDLAAGADTMDRPHMAMYRAYVLRRLKDNYRKAAALGKMPTSPNDLRAVRTIRGWDAHTVVPRFGFTDADDYYARASTGPLLDRLARPALLLATEDDPMIPPAAIRPALADASGTAAIDSFLTVRWLDRGGHLGFEKQLDLGLGLGLDGPLGVAPQVLLWLLRAASDPLFPTARNKPSS